MRMLATVLKPTEGTAKIMGYDINKNPEKVRSLIGLVPEETGVYDRLSPFENLIFFGRLNKMEPKKLKSRATEVLSMLGLEEKMDVPAGHLSKGMKRKIAFARAILHDPEILILDEPTLGIDVISARDIRNMILEAASRGKTVLLSSHNMWLVQKVCSELAIINKGKIIFEGSVKSLEEIYKKKELEDVFINLIKEEGERYA